MAQRNANISRNIFEEAKQYVRLIQQQGPNKPPVDADMNDSLHSLFIQLRRLLGLFKTGAYVDGNLGFQIQESGVSNVNNFTIKGGDGTPEGAGRMFHDGFMCLNLADLQWNTADEVSADRIHERSTGLTATTLTFSGANWTVNEYAGRTLVPNIVNGTNFAVASNTIDTITISSGDMTTVATVKDVFRVNLSTPGAPRNDAVYMDIYLDEIDTTEDTNLLHPIIGGSPFESALRERIKHTIMVAENPTVAPTGTYLDPDGNLHHYITISVLSRDANDTITTGEIIDQINRVMVDLPTLSTEVITARGSKSSIDNRLDISINEDGTLKNEALSLALPRFRGISDIVFMPKDTDWIDTYRLHQARGMFHSEYPNGGSQLRGIYHNFDLDDLNYPLDVQVGTGPGPGGADNSNPAATTQTWYPVYIIGKDDGTLALVYSSILRAPFNVGGGTSAGPLLDNSTYDFPANGWKYWAYIGAVINDIGAAWRLIPLRKIGNHVQYEQAQKMIDSTSNQATFTQFSLAARIPETSMRANLSLSAAAGNGGNVDFQVRPASVVSASEKMLLQDLTPLGSKSEDWKLRGIANSDVGGATHQVHSNGWVPTDNFQRIDYKSTLVVTGYEAYWLYVLGFEEFADFGSGEPTWP